MMKMATPMPTNEIPIPLAIKKTRDAQPAANIPPILAMLPEPHYIYYAYLDSAANIHILGPNIDRFASTALPGLKRKHAGTAKYRQG